MILFTADQLASSKINQGAVSSHVTLPTLYFKVVDVLEAINVLKMIILLLCF